MQAPKPPSATRKGIIEAANRIVRTSGVATLTLDAVAREAGVSKGGLLYHFPSKDALIEGMIDDWADCFDAELAQEAERDELSPHGRLLRAYIRLSFRPDQVGLDYTSAMLAAVATNPKLLDSVRKRDIEWQAQLERDGIDPVKATIIRLAADGLWLADLANFASISGPLREQVEATLIAMTKEDNE